MLREEQVAFTLIVPFPPGGVADIVGRPFADALSRELKTPVIIENKAGAGGGIGMGQVAKAKPDGYTLLLALSSISILPEADKGIGRASLYPSRVRATTGRSASSSKAAGRAHHDRRLGRLRMRS